MGSMFLPRTISVSTVHNSRRYAHGNKPMKHSRVLAVLAQPPTSSAGSIAKQIPRISHDDTINGGLREIGLVPKTVYKDSWFDLVASNHLSHNVQAATGIRTGKSGYEGLVEAATTAYRNFGPAMQHNLVIVALCKAFPKPILNLIRMVLPRHSKVAREYFAAFTTVFFAWLVGPCEVREGEHDGRMEKNVVHISKCRFLEETNCVGMCLNLCKMPSQTFIKDSLGMPVNMVPNFDDMSCQMIFGQEPPALEDDPAFKRPCYRLCKSKKKHTVNCSG